LQTPRLISAGLRVLSRWAARLIAPADWQCGCFDPLGGCFASGLGSIVPFLDEPDAEKEASTTALLRRVETVGDADTGDGDDSLSTR